MTLVLLSSCALSICLWLYGIGLFLPSQNNLFNMSALSLHRNTAVFSRKSIVLLQNNLCGQTKISCPYTEKPLSFYRSPFLLISDAYLKFRDFSLTYVCKYKIPFLLTTTGKKFMSLHRNVVLRKYLENQGVSDAK